MRGRNNIPKERIKVSSHIFKAGKDGGDGLSLHVFEEIKDRRVHKRRAEDRASPDLLHDEVYGQGFRDGKKEGLEAGKKEAAQICRELGVVLKELSGLKEALFNECEKEALDLCLSIARKVVQRELEMREDSVVYILREALRAAVSTGKIMVRLNPLDLEIVMGLESEIERYTKGFAGVEFIGDSEVGRGGCLIETGRGEVDATIEGLFEEVEAVVKGDG